MWEGGGGGLRRSSSGEIDTSAQEGSLQGGSSFIGLPLSFLQSKRGEGGKETPRTRLWIPPQSRLSRMGFLGGTNLLSGGGTIHSLSKGVEAHRKSYLLYHGT